MSGLKISPRICLILGSSDFLYLTFPHSILVWSKGWQWSGDVQTFHNLLIPFSPQWFQVTLLLYDSTKMRQLLSKSVVIDDDDDDEYPWRQNAHKYYIHLTLSIFLFLWFILGNYWVFSVYLPNFIPPFHQPQDYCDKTLYIFAVGVLIISHTVLFLLIFCSCCIYFFSRQRYSSEED